MQSWAKAEIGSDLELTEKVLVEVLVILKGGAKSFHPLSLKKKGGGA